MTIRRPETVVLTKADVAALLPMSECIDVVERVFAMHARNETKPPSVLVAAKYLARSDASIATGKGQVVHFV